MNFIKLFTFLFCFIQFVTYSQQEQIKGAYFGLQYKPIIGADYIGSSTLNLNNNSFQSTFKQTLGYSFGGVVRIPIRKFIAIETGINQIKRNYNVNYQITNSSLSVSKSLSFLSFDIPTNILFFSKLSNKLFLNSALGPSFVFNPSNVASQLVTSDSIIFKAEGRRRSIFSIELNANVGFEYRTLRNGYFYLGTSARIPFKPIFDVATMYQVNGFKNVLIGSLNGAYVSFDLRYFFPIIENKGIQFQKGPVDQ